MLKTLTRHGNSFALVIDKPIMELLNISPDTPLEITTDGTALHIAPARDNGEAEKLARIRKTMHGKYAKTFKRLAK